MTTTINIENVLNQVPYSAIEQAQRVISQLGNGQNVNITCVSDSTSDSEGEWFYKVAEKLGALYLTYTVYFRLWNEGTNNYDVATTVQTGTGSSTMTFWNGGRGGSNFSYFQGVRFQNGIRQTNYDLAFVSHGHNGGTNQNIQEGYCRAMLQTMLDNSDSPIILIGQNPSVPDTMRPKVLGFSKIAKELNIGFINMHDIWIRNATPLSDYLADTIHPNVLGNELWANWVMKIFTVKNGEFSGNHSTGETRIVDHSTWADLRYWNRIGTGLTVSKDNANHETNQSCLKMVTTAVAGGRYITFIPHQTDSIAKYKGKVVSVFVRLKIETGGSANAGIVQLFDGVTVWSSQAQIIQNDYVWIAVTGRIGMTANRIQANIYCSSDGGANTVYVDRVLVVEGSKNPDSDNVGYRMEIGQTNLDAIFLVDTVTGNRLRLTSVNGVLTTTVV